MTNVQISGKVPFEPKQMRNHAISFTVNCGKDREGNYFGLRVAAFKDVAASAQAVVKQGAWVHVEGFISPGEYTGKDGVKVKTLDVIATSIVLDEKDKPRPASFDRVLQSTEISDDEIPF